MFGVILALLFASGCAAELPPTASPKTASTLRPGQPSERPETLTDLEVRGERVPALEERLRAAIAKAAPSARVDRTASSFTGGRSYFVAALIGEGAGFGVVTLSVDVPPITSGELGCGKFPDCRTERLPDGRGLIFTERPEFVAAELYRADRDRERRVSADAEVDEIGARFWTGGPSLSASPLTADQAKALALDESLTP